MKKIDILILPFPAMLKCTPENGKKILTLCQNKCASGITEHNWALVGAYVYQLHIGGRDASNLGLILWKEDNSILNLRYSQHSTTLDNELNL